jgi:hypothetical protein
MRLSLAVEELDTIIARLQHLSELANHPFCENMGDKPFSHQPLGDRFHISKAI